jgi:hypothetical protein
MEDGMTENEKAKRQQKQKQNAMKKEVMSVL